jgi:hypothetical protein
MVFERNYVTAARTRTDAVQAQDVQYAVFRNNILAGASQAGIRGSGDSTDLTFLNNTYYCTSTEDGARVVGCSGPNCVARNNLGRAQPNGTGAICVSGSGTFSNNWCYTTNNTGWCQDPVTGKTGSSSCYNPNFVSTSCGTVVDGKCSNPDFFRPAASTRGIGAGYDPVAVWDDYDNVDRIVIDVGAVETN